MFKKINSPIVLIDEIRMYADLLTNIKNVGGIVLEQFPITSFLLSSNGNDLYSRGKRKVSARLVLGL